MKPWILLVEDNPDDAHLTVSALHQHFVDLVVAVAEDGEEALACLARAADREEGAGLPHVVLLDLQLPRMDGREVLRAIRADARTKHLPVVVLTSSLEETDVASCYEGGANSYVRKPVDFDEFSRVAARMAEYWLETNRLSPGLLRGYS